MLGLESSPVLQRSLCAKIHTRPGVISSILMQWYLRTLQQRTINLSVTMGEPRRLQTMPMEFTVVKSHSSYNVILGRTGLRILGVVASTIHSMIKFPTANGIATMMAKRETLQKSQRMEEARGPTLERRTILPQMQTSEPEETTSKGT
ncbi:hypothetical protein Tco_1398481 [Tanacetum coccineum]